MEQRLDDIERYLAQIRVQERDYKSECERLTKELNRGCELLSRAMMVMVEQLNVIQEQQEGLKTVRDELERKSLRIARLERENMDYADAFKKTK